MRDSARWNPGREERAVAQGNDRNPGRQFLLGDNLPSAITAAWQDEIEIITQDDWDARSDLLPGTLIKISSIVQAGPFVRVGVSWSGRLDRRGVGTPYGWSASETIRLRRVGNGWVYVSGGRIIT